MRRKPEAFLAVLLLPLCRPEAGAAGWPEIPEAERALQAVPGHPEAPAVVLLERGTLDVSGKTLSSYLDVYKRVKVLTEEGKSHGTVSLFSSDYYRMKDLEARVHLPDGTVVPLPKDAKFEKGYSGAYDRTIVSFALPRVEPGAIVEYRYRVYFDSVLYPEPWYFQDVIPTLKSEVSCSIPKTFLFKPHLVKTVNRNVAQDLKGSVTGTTSTISIENVPPVPDEPGAPPFGDLATRVTFLPVGVADGASRIPLLESWKSLADILQGDRKSGYQFTRTHALTAGLRARKLAEGIGDPADKARALCRFVRDEIATEPFDGVGAGRTEGDDILSAKKGTPIEKALLLQIMLDAVDIESSLGFTTRRTLGAVDERLVNPGQFDAVLVAADVGGKPIFLDTSDRSVAPGALPPTLEGVRCLLVDRKEPEWLTTPVTPGDASARVAKLDLELQADGRVSGKGQLTLTGHHAWERIGWKETREKTTEAWADWLHEKMPAFDAAGVTVEERADDRVVDVTFRMTLRDEEVLGNEVSLPVAAPLQQRTNPFTLSPEKRLTPVLIAFADSDQLTMTVGMPAGWRVSSRPSLKSLENAAGKLTSTLDVDETARRVRLTRRLDTFTAEVGRVDYAALKALQEAAVANDAELLVLARK